MTTPEPAAVVREAEENSPRGCYITPADAHGLLEHLPAYVRDFFAVAYDYGIRKGQLARTLRHFVDVERRVIEWPAAACKHKETHVVPLEGDGLTIVSQLMENSPLWCPYLFHGPRCAPGQAPSKRYACLGDFKKAWRTACTKAGLAAGRKAGGYVFHHTRNTAATNLRAGGMEEVDAMKITGHQTSHVFRHYDLGNVDVLRERLSQARSYAKSLPTTSKPKVTPIGSRRQRGATTPKQRVAR